MPHAVSEARFWDKAARGYARDPIKDMAGYERTVQRTGGLLRPSDKVLEIGCGTGSTALRLAPLVAEIVATDLSGEMIAIAREKAEAAACRNARFEAAGAGDPPEGEGAYDAALAFNVLHLVADRRHALARLFGALKPGGAFISKTPCLSEMNPLIRLAVPLMRMIGKAPFVAFFTAAELEAEVAAAGFAIEARERHGSGAKDPRIVLIARKPLA